MRLYQAVHPFLLSSIRSHLYSLQRSTKSECPFGKDVEGYYRKSEISGLWRHDDGEFECEVRPRHTRDHPRRQQSRQRLLVGSAGIPVGIQANCYESGRFPQQRSTQHCVSQRGQGFVERTDKGRSHLDIQLEGRSIGFVSADVCSSQQGRSASPHSTNRPALNVHVGPSCHGTNAIFS